MIKWVQTILLSGVMCSAHAQLIDLGPRTASLLGMQSISHDLAGLNGNPAFLTEGQTALALGFANRYGIREWSSMQAGMRWTGKQRALAIGTSLWQSPTWIQRSALLHTSMQWRSTSIGTGIRYRQWCTEDQRQADISLLFGSRVQWRHWIYSCLVQLNADKHLQLLPSSKISLGIMRPLNTAVKLIMESSISYGQPKLTVGLDATRKPWILRLSSAIDHANVGFGLERVFNNWVIHVALQSHPYLGGSPFLALEHAIN